MIKVHIKFVGTFQRATGKSNFAAKIKDNISLRETVKTVAEELPEIREVIGNRKSLHFRPNTLVLVNGREISVLNGLDTTLKDGDEIVFVPVSHGG